MCDNTACDKSEHVATFRVEYDGEHLYDHDVCEYHAKLYRGSKFAEELQ